MYRGIHTWHLPELAELPSRPGVQEAPEGSSTQLEDRALQVGGPPSYLGRPCLSQARPGSRQQGLWDRGPDLGGSAPSVVSRSHVPSRSVQNALIHLLNILSRGLDVTHLIDMSQPGGNQRGCKKWGLRKWGPLQVLGLNPHIPAPRTDPSREGAAVRWSDAALRLADTSD